MKNQNLYLVGGALLASTALATTASAATIANGANNSAAIVEFEASVLAVEVFPSDDPEDLAIGPFDLILDLTNAQAAAFNYYLRVAGATVTSGSAGTVSLFGQEGSSLTTMTGAGCTVSVSDDLILLECDPTDGSGGTATASAVELSGISFENAEALAEADAEITISGYRLAGNFTFDVLDSTTLISSGPGVDVTIEENEDNVIIVADSDPTLVFINDDDGATDEDTTVNLGTIAVTINDVVDESLAALNAAALLGAAEVTLEHALLAQEAVVEADIGALADAVEAEDFDGDTVVFDVAAGATTAAAGVAVTVEIDGETPLEVTGAGSLEYAAEEGTGVEQGTEADGSMSALLAGGLNTDLNYLLASGGGFTSYIRVTNTGASDGPVTVTLLDAATGEQLGDSFDTDEIVADATLQLSSDEIEEAAGYTVDAADVPLYNVKLSSGIVGYAQHILYNTSTTQVSDLSAQRQ